jgi:hypothetical protein
MFMSKESTNLELIRLRKRFLENLVESYSIVGASVISKDSDSYGRVFDELKDTLKETDINREAEDTSEYAHS